MERDYKPEDAESIVDDYSTSLYAPQFPSMRVELYFATNELREKTKRLLKVSGVNFQHRYVPGYNIREIAQVRVPQKELKENKDFYIDLLRRLINMGVVQSTEANYFS